MQDALQRVLVKTKEQILHITSVLYLLLGSPNVLSLADLVLKNGRIVNVFTDEIDTADTVSYTHLDVYKRQGQIRYLNPGQAPNAVFELGSEKPVAVYAYCNLHGLWMTKL